MNPRIRKKMSVNTAVTKGFFSNDTDKSFVIDIRGVFSYSGVDLLVGSPPIGHGSLRAHFFACGVGK